MNSIVRYVVLAAALGGTAYGVSVFPGLFGDSRDAADDFSTYTVQRRTLADRIVERGTVESQKTVYGKCEIPNRTKITFIVPEGTQVKKGDKVVAFETNELDKDIAQKKVAVNEAKGKLAEAVQSLEIKNNENATNIATAELEYEIAKIDLIKYREGDFLAEEAEIERAIKEAEAGLEKVREEKKNIEILVKKGYKTPQQLVEVQLRENTFQFMVERDKQKHSVLIKYDRQKKMIEFEGKRKETELKLERAKKTANAETIKAESAVENAKNGLKILEQQLEESLDLLKKCVLCAEQAGTVAYANERWYDPTRRIREGTEMYSGRNVYYLPDMSRMQVKANVHESVINRIKVDQNATIRLDAFSDVKLSGTISSVAGMAASSYSSVQNYETVILIDEIPDDLSLKPGMTAEVDILVGTYEDVIAVPVGAITEQFDQMYVYVLAGGTVDRRLVEAGRVTHSFVEITAGLEEGDVVALDAYQRGLEDFADVERESASSGPPSSAPLEGGA